MQAVLSGLASLIQFIGKFLFEYWGWVPVVAVLGYLIWQNSRRTRWLKQTEFELLSIAVPGDQPKSEVAADGLFAGLHGTYRPKQEVLKQGIIQEHLSFEITASAGRAHYFIWLPKHLHDFVTTHILAQYPDAKIARVGHDYSEASHPVNLGWELTLNNDPALPIRTYQDLEADAADALAAVLGRITAEDERLSLQVLIRPIDDSWHQRANRVIAMIKSSGIPQHWGGKYLQLPGYIAKNGLKALWRPPTTQADTTSQLDDIQKTQIEAVGNKIAKPGFRVRVRAVYGGKSTVSGEEHLQALFGAFKQFSNNTNSFRIKRSLEGENAHKFFRARWFNASRRDILNSEELASLYHLPSNAKALPLEPALEEVNEKLPTKLPTTKTMEASELSPIGSLQIEDSKLKIGLRRADRDRHVYVIGQTGTGKSSLLELLAISDIHYGHGLGLIDSSGNFAKQILKYIPKKRTNDIVYFKPASTTNAYGLNPLLNVPPSLRSQVANELVEILRNYFGKGWNARIEYLLRYALLALLESNSARLTDIIRLLTEASYRQFVIEQLTDPVVKNFWVNDFADWGERYRDQAVTAALNKLGSFLNNHYVNAVLSAKEVLDLNAIINTRQVLLVNLSPGLMGEREASAIGAILLSQLHLAAAVAHGQEKEIKPFYLYVDDFQNFVTDSFATLLADARRYGLNLTLSNQYVAQMPETVREAVFGNVDSLISFRVGADDARELARYIEPNFGKQDLINLHQRHFIARISVGGEKTPALMAASLSLPKPAHNYSKQIVADATRRKPPTRPTHKGAKPSNKTELKPAESIKLRNHS